MTISSIRLANAANGRAPVGRLPAPADAKAIRQAAQVRRVDLANVVGVSGMTVWRWENGRAEPANWMIAARYGRALAFLSNAVSKQATKAVGAA